MPDEDCSVEEHLNPNVRCLQENRIHSADNTSARTSAAIVKNTIDQHLSGHHSDPTLLSSNLAKLPVVFSTKRSGCDRGNAIRYHMKGNKGFGSQ